MIKGFFSKYNQLTSILFGLVTAWMVSYYSYYAYYKYRSIDNIYEASLIVPDFFVGQDPNVVYINDKREEFQGQFTVEVKNTDEEAVCRGKGGPFTYSVGEKTTVRTLNEYIWIDPVTNVISVCSQQLKKGFYYIETTFFIRQEGRPERIYGPVRSNIFEVKEKDESIEQGPSGASIP